jgi:hypothetical protein
MVLVKEKITLLMTSNVLQRALNANGLVQMSKPLLPPSLTENLNSGE